MVYALNAKSTIYLQFFLQLNRRLRGKEHPFLVYPFIKWAISNSLSSLPYSSIGG
jgi:hypothetical protein